MKMCKNVRLTPLRREEMARGVLAGEMSRPEAARSFGVAPKTVSKWVGHFRDFGPAGMPDRSSRPRRMRRPTPAHVVERIVHLRRCRLTGAHIASATGVSTATVSRILKRAGLSRIKDLEPEEPARRYEHDNPGDMSHLDIKKIGRFVRPGHRATGTRAGRRQGSGWEYAHICVDDASRIACGGLFPNESQESAVQSLRASVAYYKRLGVTVRRVTADNGPCYTSHAFAAACKGLGVRHVRTSPTRPGPMAAPSFIQTAMKEWGCARTYETSERRAADLPAWVHMYNWHRPHAALGARPPISRLRMDRDNLSMHHNPGLSAGRASGAESLAGPLLCV